MIRVLRLGHRKDRDKRVTTHVALVARAFGASGIVYTGEKDPVFEETMRKVTSKWGGRFSVSYSESRLFVLERHRKAGFSIAHLTMYGLPIQNVMRDVRKRKKLLVIVGGEKVPGEIYAASDFNISVTNQPHSEVAALAVFLHEYFQGKELAKRFPGAKLRIRPMARGKSFY